MRWPGAGRRDSAGAAPQAPHPAAGSSFTPAARRRRVPAHATARTPPTQPGPHKPTHALRTYDRAPRRQTPRGPPRWCRATQAYTQAHVRTRTRTRTHTHDHPAPIIEPRAGKGLEVLSIGVAARDERAARRRAQRGALAGQRQHAALVGLLGAVAERQRAAAVFKECRGAGPKARGVSDGFARVS